MGTPLDGASDPTLSGNTRDSATRRSGAVLHACVIPIVSAQCRCFRAPAWLVAVHKNRRGRGSSPWGSIAPPGGRSPVLQARNSRTSSGGPGGPRTMGPPLDGASDPGLSGNTRDSATGRSGAVLHACVIPLVSAQCRCFRAPAELRRRPGRRRGTGFESLELHSAARRTVAGPKLSGLSRRPWRSENHGTTAGQCLGARPIGQYPG